MSVLRPSVHYSEPFWILDQDVLKILHVDRSELFRKVIREMVLRSGHAVVSVARSDEAQDALVSGGYDLVVTALELDDGNAENLIRDLLASKAREIPVIVVTSTDSLEQRERFFSLGVVDYMLKNDLSEERFRRYFDSLAAGDELSRSMRSLRVAVLDDSQVILKIVSRILSLNGFESFRLFSDPLELFKSREEFDLYLTDIVLPNMSGERVVSRLRVEHPEAIILSMSKFTGEKPLSNILLAGADDYIHKPFDSAALMSRVRVNVRSYLLKKRLEKMALTDGLTGLFNHRYSYERIELECAKSCRYGRSFSLAMIDIDDFKRVNDTHGHRKGNEVLAAVARTCKESLREVDLVGRYGGEEFVIGFPETALAAARFAAEKLRLAIDSLSLGGLSVTVSLGIAEYSRDESVENLVSRADANLYEAKRAGKNKVVG